MFNTALIKRYFLRLLAGEAIDFRTRFIREHILCEIEETLVPRALYLDDETDRITGLSPWRDWRSEEILIRGGPVRHNPSKIIEFHDVEIFGAYIYSGSAKFKVGIGAPQLWSSSARSIEMPEATLRSCPTSSNFFGHLLLDEFPLGLLDGANAPDISMVSKYYGHENEYREIFNLPRPQQIDRGRIGRLLMFIDNTQNSNKRERYEELRKTVRRALPQPAGSSNSGVYIKRGSFGEHRHLTNEVEIETLLKASGFEIVDPDSDSASEIAKKTLNTKFVIGVEGSQFSHALYTPADAATFVVLQPPDRFAMAYKEYTDCVGMRFAFVVGERTEDGFMVPVERLRRLLEKTGL